MQQHFDPKQTADYLNIPEATLATWRCTKRVRIPYCKLGSNVRYKKSDLDAYIAANMHDAQGGDE